MYMFPTLRWMVPLLLLLLLLLLGIGLLTGDISPATLAAFYHAALSGVSK